MTRVDSMKRSIVQFCFGKTTFFIRNRIIETTLSLQRVRNTLFRENKIYFSFNNAFRIRAQR